MTVLLTVVGLLLIGLVMWDLLVTVLSASGAGILTRAWSEPLWSGLLAVHRRRPIHGVLALTGPAMILFGILLWYGLIAVGAFLVLSSFSSSVVRSSDRTPVDASNDAYFVGSTLSGLGYGDVVPSGFPWTLFSSVAALLGTIVLTTSLSYILAVLTPAVQRKSLASSVRVLGSSPSEIAETAKLHDPAASLQPYVTSLCTQMSELSAKHLAFPVLRHFHASTESLAPGRAVLLLSDATFLMSCRSTATTPPPGMLAMLRRTMDDYAGVRQGSPPALPDHDVQRRYLRAEARCLGIETGPGYEVAEDDYLGPRDRLLSLCADDGWAL